MILYCACMPLVITVTGDERKVPLAWSRPSYVLGVQVVETWMDLESVIQSEVSQKEKNKYIATHICGF